MIKKNLFSIIIALMILYLSFASKEALEKVAVVQFRGMDKIVHFIMYFTLMMSIILEHRKQLPGTRWLFTVALIPFLYGGIIEICQSLFTRTRSGSLFDLMFNTAGILLSIAIYLSYRRLKNNNLR